MVIIIGVRYCMTILITNAYIETWIVAIGLLIVLVATMQRTREAGFFSKQTTVELKGLAILAVIFSHIGYFLVSDHQFLVPLSNYAGVGVDLFLVLSGYGLMAAALQRPMGILSFYKKRLYRLYVSVVFTIFLLLLTDFFFANRTYQLSDIIKNLFGFFPHADVYQDIDSPLWYITPLLANYLVFPLVFWRRLPIVSSLVVGILGWCAVRFLAPLNLVTVDVMKLYQLHFLAFPFGMFMGALINKPGASIAAIVSRAIIFIKKPWMLNLTRLFFFAIAALIFGYTYFNSRVGEGWKVESLTSLATVIAVLAVFIVKPVNFRFLSWFGAFSFEIYLLHWPLLYRYNFIYGSVPAGAATIISLALILLVGYVYHVLITGFFSTVSSASL